MKKIIAFVFLSLCVMITTGAGYVGTLPDVEAEFESMRKEADEKASAPHSVNLPDKNAELKMIPSNADDDGFVDIIVKKAKKTAYASDIDDVITILEKLRICLNTNRDIQKFNAIVSNLIDNVEYIKTEYKDKPESAYLSYERLIAISALARDCASFAMKALSSEKYLPYTSPENTFTKENYDKKFDNLLVKVNETLFLLKNSG